MRGDSSFLANNTSGCVQSVGSVTGAIMPWTCMSCRIFLMSSRHEMGMVRAFDRANSTASGTSSIDIGGPFMVSRGSESSNTYANSSRSFAFRVWAVSGGDAETTTFEFDGAK